MKYLNQLIIAAIVTFMTTPVLAELPKPTIPEGAQEGDMLSIGSTYLLLAAGIIGGLIVFGTFAGVAWGIYRKWGDAVTDGRSGWGEVGGAAVGGVVIMLFVGVIVYFGYSYLAQALGQA